MAPKGSDSPVRRTFPKTTVRERAVLMNMKGKTVATCLMSGDPQEKEYGDTALPRLLSEGWTVLSMNPMRHGGDIVILRRVEPDASPSK